MDFKKTLAWALVGYLLVVSGAQFLTNSSSNSPTADSISAWPSVSSFLSISGTQSGAAVDLAAAAAVWYFLLRK